MIDKLFDAIKLVEKACIKFVEKGFFKQGVLNRFRLWIKSLDRIDIKNLADEIARKAATSVFILPS